jgi:glutamate 5-kinase
MLSKVLAAKRAARSGASTIIASGREPDVLVRLMAGESIGTLLTASVPKRAARKQWLADHLQTKGRVLIDAGAAAALCSQGKSLLPIGVREVHGVFARGDVVACVDEHGPRAGPRPGQLLEFGDAPDRAPAQREIAQVLGFIEEPELIHRDNLVLLVGGPPEHPRRAAYGGAPVPMPPGPRSRCGNTKRASSRRARSYTSRLNSITASSGIQ